jgi:hypothetical protein
MWHLAGGDLDTPGYDGQTPMEVVSVWDWEPLSNLQTWIVKATQTSYVTWII